MNQEKLTTLVLQRIQSNFQDPSDIINFSSPRNDGRHFLLEIKSNQFEGLSRIQRHQMVYEILDDLLTTGKIHALQLKLHTL